MNREVTQDLGKIISHYGVSMQLEVAMEECAELTQAIVKHNRKRSDETLSNLCEEIADVQIMLEQLKIIFGFKDIVPRIIDRKIKRQLKRINIGD